MEIPLIKMEEMCNKRQGVVFVTKDNIDSEEAQRVLY